MADNVNITEQAPPVDGVGPDCWQLVLADMAERRVAGIAKYSKPLRPDNGRDGLVDAYQEALDLCVYLRQTIEQRKALEALAAKHERHLAFAHDWYAVRWERLRKLIREQAPDIEDAACCIMANGTADVYEVPTYGQMMSRAGHEVARLKKENRELTAKVKELEARNAAPSATTLLRECVDQGGIDEGKFSRRGANVRVEANKMTVHLWQSLARTIVTVEVYRDPTLTPNYEGMPANMLVVPPTATDEEVVLAALKRWKELHGE